MKEAIQKAIEGGWKDSALDVNTSMSDWPYPCTLDPLFWQALGKAMGWNEREIEIPHPAREVRRVDKVNGGSITYQIPNSIARRTVKNSKWKKEWHHFIDYLAEEKTPDDFFKELLTNK